MNELLLGVLLLAAGNPVRQPDAASHPERLRPGTAGTISILEPTSATTCDWSRVEPGAAPELVHTFPAGCTDGRVFWSRDGLRALIILWDKNDLVAGWEADLRDGKLWALVPTGDERLWTGFVAPHGAITLVVGTVERKRSGLRETLGIGRECEPGRSRALGLSEDGKWAEIDVATWGCKSKDNLDYTDYTWSRPGVVEIDAGSARFAEVKKRLPPKAGVHQARARGEFVLAYDSWQGAFVLAPDRVHPAVTGKSIGFWPAPVLPEWDVKKERPKDWSDTP